MMYNFFFFQAEDGIRDDLVTGVQTCALPIFASSRALSNGVLWPISRQVASGPVLLAANWAIGTSTYGVRNPQIGRASCRERVEIRGVDGAEKKKKERKE